jgi:hypothetical protein
MKPKALSLNLDLRKVFGTAIFQALSKPHRKANLDTGTQLNENHASTISSGNRNGTVFDNVSALCTRTFQTRPANKFHGLTSISGKAAPTAPRWPPQFFSILVRKTRGPLEVRVAHWGSLVRILKTRSPELHAHAPADGRLSK